MEKNHDLFFIQQCLLKRWLTPTQISHCTKLLQRSPGVSFPELLFQKNYLTKEQIDSLEKLWKESPAYRKAKIACCTCKEETWIENYEPDQTYLCSKCKKELPGPDTQAIPEETKAEKNITQESDGKGFPLFDRHFGVYKVLSEIGRGGMGIVYKVKHPDIEFPLAMKILMQQDSREGENVMRFFREIELSSKLRHPNIVGIHDVGTFNDSPYYTMDYIEGETLDKLLKKGQKFSEPFALQIIEKIAQALGTAHKAKIIHRDIKPANIILDKENRPYLMDFGIATCHDKIFKKLTRTGTIMGTPDYMPPEQASGANHLICFASDVYSLGATLYHLLTGFPPFEGKTAIQVITQVTKGNFIPISHRNPNISKQTQAVVMKAMALSIQDRYAHAGIFAMDLRALLTGSKTIARPKSFFQNTLQFVKKNSILVSCIAVSTLSLAIAIFLILGKLLR